MLHVVATLACCALLLFLLIATGDECDVANGEEECQETEKDDD
jgi:hypothetical protein